MLKTKDTEAIASAAAEAAQSRVKRLELHTGKCGATKCSCPGWVRGQRDYAGWEMCGEDNCSHTKDSHERAEKETADAA